jgi:hypothetical protein
MRGGKRSCERQLVAFLNNVYKSRLPVLSKNRDGAVVDRAALWEISDPKEIRSKRTNFDSGGAGSQANLGRLSCDRCRRSKSLVVRRRCREYRRQAGRRELKVALRRCQDLSPQSSQIDAANNLALENQEQENRRNTG